MEEEAIVTRVVLQGTAWGGGVTTLLATPTIPHDNARMGGGRKHDRMQT